MGRRMGLKFLAVVFLLSLAACAVQKAVDYYGPIDFGTVTGREQGVLRAP